MDKCTVMGVKGAHVVGMMCAALPQHSKQTTQSSEHSSASALCTWHRPRAECEMKIIPDAPAACSVNSLVAQEDEFLKQHILHA
eukprot:235608-Pelagomonas_calceolata.AAC.3